MLLHSVLYSDPTVLLNGGTIKPGLFLIISGQFYHGRNFFNGCILATGKAGKAESNVATAINDKLGGYAGYLIAFNHLVDARGGILQVNQHLKGIFFFIFVLPGFFGGCLVSALPFINKKKNDVGIALVTCDCGLHGREGSFAGAAPGGPEIKDNCLPFE